MNKPLQSYIIVSALQFGTHCRIELMSFSHDSCTYDACLAAILTSTRLRLLSLSLVLCLHVGGYVSSLDSFCKLSEYSRLSVTSMTAFGILPKHLVYGRSSGDMFPTTGVLIPATSLLPLSTQTIRALFRWVRASHSDYARARLATQTTCGRIQTHAFELASFCEGSRSSMYARDRAPESG